VASLSAITANESTLIPRHVVSL
jgi:galactokinase